MSPRNMEAIYPILLMFICFLFLATFIDPVSSLDPISPDDTSGNNHCVLNFTQYPYQPSGNCLTSNEKILQWNSLKTTLCCKNALNAFSQALALNALLTQSKIFLTEDLWANCSGPFLRQHSVSWSSCKFDQIFSGSDKCSTLTLPTIKQQESYNNALKACFHFDKQFNEVCNSCAKAVLDLRNQLLGKLGVKKNENEKAVCGMASVIAIASEMLDNHSLTEDFFGCLNALDELIDPGYIRLKRSLVSTIFAVTIGIATLLILTVLINCVSKKRPLRAVRSKQITNAWSSCLYRFSRAEIENAINYGNEKKYLGSGSAGEVYKGMLPSGQVVAIKYIKKGKKSDSFAREVEGLSRVRHPNLVCLFGCCDEDGEKFLVYEYCSAGNLAQNLLRDDTVLTWKTRVKILRNCVLALRHLHHFIDGCIVHRDIKLSNILLTEKMEPKLSDFGLARMLGMEESSVFTAVRGTIGYMDPEYMCNAHLTCASDIYSFGIVMLQLLSGQKVIELDLDARDQLTRKAKDVDGGKRPLSDFIDPRLEVGDINEADFRSILQIAVLCVSSTSIGRPNVDDVFAELDKAWKNTVDSKKAKQKCVGTSSSTPMSRSIEVMPD